jgi:sugar/nucleoside kinase (ribokinase family)
LNVIRPGRSPFFRQIKYLPKPWEYGYNAGVLVQPLAEELVMNHLFVIGGAANDRLHLPDQTVNAVGGAGMYTAMAARRCGARVTMFGLRPDPCPEHLQPVARYLTTWLGPDVPPAQLPQFEISYRGGKTTYLNAIRGAEPMLSPTMLPADLSQIDLLHVTPQSDPDLQLSFLQAGRERGAAKIAAGTDPDQAVQQPDAVWAIMAQSDYFFMNSREAEAIFGSLQSVCTEPGKVLFVTLGAQGALVIQGDSVTPVPAVSAPVRDPTGAGDTFCGGTLAYLLQGHQPIMAARQAAALAAEMIGQVGPAALLSTDPPPRVPQDDRVRVNADRVQKIARALTPLADASQYPLVGPAYPPAGHPQAMDYFFAATLQQFSFWSERNNRYHQPLIALIGGVERKGSDYLWAAYTRRLEIDAEFCSPERQANLSRDEYRAVFRSDDGRDPLPVLDLHLDQARRYGRDMVALQLTPQRIVDHALAATHPLQKFLLILDHVGGYKEDLLRKKSLLLAMILHDRPEAFLPFADGEKLAPLMDYHHMRSSLRIGLIDVLDRELSEKLINRQVVSPADEWAVRYPAYQAFEQLVTLSGRSLNAVNNYLFTNARKHCPEMTAPDCSACQLQPVCAQRKAFFQPVFRTTFY